MMNDRSRNTLITRSKMVTYIRRYLDERVSITAITMPNALLIRS